MTPTDNKIDVRVHPIKAWNVETMEGKETAFIFQFEDDSVEGISIPKEIYSAFATRILKEAQKFAVEGKVKPTGSEVVKVDPIQVPSISIGRGRTESEAILAMDIGNLQLAFAVELNALAGLCMGLAKMTKIAPDQTKN